MKLLPVKQKKVEIYDGKYIAQLRVRCQGKIFIIEKIIEGRKNTALIFFLFSCPNIVVVYEISQYYPTIY